MKVLIIFALFAASQATVVLNAPAVVSTGTSTQYRTQDNIGNYAFGYDEGHLTGGTFRKESGDVNGNKIGSYGLRDADGRVRIVNYIADAAGFRADIKTNEPGIEPKDPANTTINKAGLIVTSAAPSVAYTAPSVTYAAPAVTYAAPAATYTSPALASAYHSIALAAPLTYAPKPVHYAFRQYPTLTGYYY